MDTVLARARTGDDLAFRELTDPYLRELRLHCYRILGSVQDAEDAMQETLLAAWRGLSGYEGRASVRTWLYRIATNRCLNALRAGGRQPRASLEPPFVPPEPTRRGEPIWLEPYPDADLPDVVAGPDALYEARETVALAFITAVQHLPPRQRAVLLLRDVLSFRSAEVAEMLDASAASVNSALQRARGAMAGLSVETARLPRSAVERDLAERFAAAYTSDDVDAVVALLTDDAWCTMPPATLEYQGHAAIGTFLRESASWRSGPYRLIPTRANGQPAFGVYLPDGDLYRSHGLVVLTVRGDRICAITRFVDSAVTGLFGLPRVLLRQSWPRPAWPTAPRSPCSPTTRAKREVSRTPRTPESQDGRRAVPAVSARPIIMSVAQALIIVSQTSPVAIQSSPTPGPVDLAPAAHARSAPAPPASAHPSAMNR
jgi:RNA polymerase sigma-70 factor (TIGR02960 family)